MRGKSSTGQAVKAGAIRQAAERVVTEDMSGDDRDVYHQIIGRAERLQTIVSHQHFGEVEAILLEEIFALGFAKDENLLIRASAARSSLRALDKIYEAIKRGQEAAKYLAEIDKTAKEEVENENPRRTPSRRGSQKARS